MKVKLKLSGITKERFFIIPLVGLLNRQTNKLLSFTAFSFLLLSFTFSIKKNQESTRIPHVSQTKSGSGNWI